MADPVTIALKGAGTAFTICVATHNLIQGIKKAPKDITRVATDLESFYGILGALQGFIETQRLALNRPGPAAYQLQNITSLIDNCVAAFQEVQQKIQDFIALNGKVISGLSKAFKWELFRREDVHYLGEHLSNMKLGLNLALTSLTLLVVTSTHSEILAVRRDISHLRIQLKTFALQETPNNGFPIRASIASMSSCLSFASTGSIASSRQSIAVFVAETENLVDRLDDDETVAVPSSDDSTTAVSELVEFAKKELANIEGRRGLVLNLSGRSLPALPIEVVTLIKDEVVVLALSHNPYIMVPSEIIQCHILLSLDLQHNKLEHFPEAILQLPSLSILDLSTNSMPSIPDAINNMTSLEYLYVARNKITRLPLALGDMSKLKYLTIAQNPLEFPPLVALDLPDSDRVWMGIERGTCTWVKQYLRDAARQERLSADSGQSTSGGDVEIPRPPRSHAISGRFPVRPSVSGIRDVDNSEARAPRYGSRAGPREWYPPVPFQDRGKEGRTTIRPTQVLSYPESGKDSDGGKANESVTYTLRNGRGTSGRKAGDDDYDPAYSGSEVHVARASSVVQLPPPDATRERGFEATPLEMAVETSQWDEDAVSTRSVATSTAGYWRDYYTAQDCYELEA
ncbi:RAM signaling network component [Elasticomyces elasticus]|nr:RAM signaling network component [Elasticomyces elasticus]